ncbi:hypothetical protein Selin_1457 [Desulfurispirillum indicum S5]|uniref:Type IV conjugative transfer system protein TraE n=1 Tax=Desulfurispirillum indicum (strain ATCC BAA-1389 / DSM 22839 / S5) TaxID=653733 RepID=E6W6U8_DESIS|nr:type IV conjugative transfer system protein TraE [Desulfurispirillum indicum]ADU66191.1 hypothetical protein Selin_1457 [Desulfurispirillum indicum S5]
MRRYKHLSSTARVVAKNKILLLAIVAIAFLQLLSYSTIREFSQTHRTIIQPTVVDQPYWIEGGSASAEYVQLMGRHALDLLLNYHPRSAAYQFNTLSSLYSPGTFAAAQEYYGELAERISAMGFSSVYYPSKFTITPDTITAEGMRTRWSATGKTDQQETYEITYAIRHGRFEISNIREVKR